MLLGGVMQTEGNKKLTTVDVGGTFTDFVTYAPDLKQIKVWKRLSTPDNPTDGIIDGLKEGGIIEDIGHLRLGTTIVTNAILERKGATVGYITTSGFKDIPFIGRGQRQSHYDITWIKPKPLIKRRYCYEVKERIGSEGEVIEQLNEKQVRKIAQNIKENENIESIAVTLIFGYANPEHEYRIKEILKEEIPNIFVSISYQVFPKWREYQRASTTIADAYVKPLVSRHLDDFSNRLQKNKAKGYTSVIRSNGGEMSLEMAADRPIEMALSGPTGGVVGAKRLAELIDVKQVVTLDMGGTSTDVSTVVNGYESFTTNFEIEFGIPIQIPMIDIRTIGAGGGSIAWLDAGKMLRVGPQSAGANPGPACYALGGEQATVTDANVVLGRIDPNMFLGGKMVLDKEAAVKVVEKVATELKLGLFDAAVAIVRIANVNMVGALRSVLTERGLDPRDFTLVAFGGAGPVHITDLMFDIGINKGIVPMHPGQFSAFGFIMTDARVDMERTAQMSSVAFDSERMNRIISEISNEAISALKRQGYSENIHIQKMVEMRYFAQNHELQVPIAYNEFTPENRNKSFEDFHKLHHARFGFSTPGEKIEIVNVGVTAIAIGEPPELPEIEKAKEETVISKSDRKVYFEDKEYATKVYLREELLNGHIIEGPALVEENASVTVVRPGIKLSVDKFGNLILDKK